VRSKTSTAFGVYLRVNGQTEKVRGRIRQVRRWRMKVACRQWQCAAACRHSAEQVSTLWHENVMQACRQAQRGQCSAVDGSNTAVA